MRLPVQDDVLCAGVVVSTVLLLVMLSRGARDQRTHAPQVTRAAKDLVGQGVTLARAAEEQQSHNFKLQHCAQAAAFLNAARMLCTDEELVRVSNVDVHTELRGVEAAQRKLLARPGKQSVPQKNAKTAGSAKGTHVELNLGRGF